ncbi:Pre-mRNA-splicing factor ATP-dependent RNA helicase DEAH1 [Cardamine amara subsp. amara]|uniref:Pre-mRNA-splicing factor ATP-dependent RNA helicase DEAH1 n=1 Tax=Cardamine amara subsp. amara TaxID=228776 RepID=A0ABD1AWZ7_CARAN
MAKKLKSPAELVRELVDYGFPLSDETHTFAEEVYTRVPRKTAGVNLYQKHEAEAALLLKAVRRNDLLQNQGSQIKDEKGSGRNLSNKKMTTTMMRQIVFS